MPRMVHLYVGLILYRFLSPLALLLDAWVLQNTTFRALIFCSLGDLFKAAEHCVDCVTVLDVPEPRGWHDNNEGHYTVEVQEVGSRLSDGSRGSMCIHGAPGWLRARLTDRRVDVTTCCVYNYFTHQCIDLCLPLSVLSPLTAYHCYSFSCTLL